MYKLGALIAVLSAVSASPLLSRQAGGWPAPEPSSGNITDVQDPALIRRDDGKWFRFSSRGNIAIASAPSANGPWTYEGAMLPDGGVMHLGPDDGMNIEMLWAPDISKIRDTYYAYYTMSRAGVERYYICVATSPSLEVGSWTDHGSIGNDSQGAPNGWINIQPNLFQGDDDSRFLLNFGLIEGAFNLGFVEDGIWQTQLNNIDAMSYESNPPPRELVRNHTDPTSDAPFEFWLPNAGPENQNYYYMFYSQGMCCRREGDLAPPGDEYRIYVCRSEAALGPFVDANGNNCLANNGGTLVLGSHDDVYAPGGQGVYLNPENGEIILYYHYVNLTLAVDDVYALKHFQYGFNRLDFRTGWPVVTTA